MWDYFSCDVESNKSVCHIEISDSVCGKRKKKPPTFKKRGTSLMYYQSTLKEAFSSELCTLKIAASTKQLLGSLPYLWVVLMLPIEYYIVENF